MSCGPWLCCCCAVLFAPAAAIVIRVRRHLSWQSDDLTALGPVLSAYTQFTTLRSLSLSCTSATLARACEREGSGERGGCQQQELFNRIMPYCRMDFIN